MSVRSSRPREGPVASIGTNVLERERAQRRRRRRARSRDGRWRPNVRFDRRHGVLVTLRREPGLTGPRALRVPFRFQVPALDQLDRPFRHRWTTFDTIEQGQGLGDSGRELLEVQLTTMLMDDVAVATSENVVAWDHANQPQHLLDELLWIMGNRRAPAVPFRLVMSQPTVWDDPIVDMVAVITDLTPTQPTGETGVERLSVTFLEMPEQEVARRRQPGGGEKRRHRIRLGHDDLHELAKRYYRAASEWRRIAHANGIRGVSPGSAAELERWARRHHRTHLVIPPRGSR